MGRLHYQLEMLRGSIQEMQGRLQQMMSDVRSIEDVLPWTANQIGGLALQARGKGRKALAMTQMRTAELTDEAAKRPVLMGTVGGLLLAGIGLGVAAALYPHIFVAFWNWIRTTVSRLAGAPEGVGTPLSERMP